MEVEPAFFWLESGAEVFFSAAETTSVDAAWGTSCVQAGGGGILVSVAAAVGLSDDGAMRP